MTVMIVILYSCEILAKNTSVVNVGYNIIPLTAALFLMPQVESTSIDSNKLDSNLNTGDVWRWIAILCLVLCVVIVIANNVATDTTRNDNTASSSSILPLYQAGTNISNEEVASDLNDTSSSTSRKKIKKMTIAEAYEADYKCFTEPSVYN